MKKKNLVLLLIILSVVANGCGTALQSRLEYASIVGFVMGVIFLIAAVVVGVWNRTE